MIIFSTIISRAWCSLAEFYAVSAQRITRDGVILAMSLIGAIVGIWVSGMIASNVPNTRLKKFSRDIEQGKILLMVDVPKDQIKEITALIREQYPDADVRGRDPTIPAFP